MSKLYLSDSRKSSQVFCRLPVISAPASGRQICSYLCLTCAKEVMFLPGFVCGFVSLFVNKITQKLMDGY